MELRETFPDIKLIFLDVHSLLENAIAEPDKYRLSNTTEPCYEGTYSGWYNSVQIKPDLIYSDLKKKNKQFNEKRWLMIKDNPELFTAAQLGYLYGQRPYKALEQPSTCYGYLFWDHIHPTTEVHRVIANEAKKLIREAGLEAAMPDPGSAEVSKQKHHYIQRRPN